ncbi:MAG: polysaccharide deacetylase family protein [Bacillota bacterium]
MKRTIAPLLLSALLLLSACGSTPSRHPSPDAPPALPAPPAQSPAQPAPAQPDRKDRAEAPEPKPPSGVSGEVPSPVHVEPTPVPTRPEVTWMPRGIGLPLVPSDPAAADRKVVLLTFDDGPSEWTVPILETLAQEQVKAVFFITGYGARNHPELVERIHREGHTLAVHTMTHPNMARLAPADQRKEIEPLVELIQQVTGQKPRYFRPPFGAYDQNLLRLLKEMEMELINWTNGSLDWEGVIDGYKDPHKVVDDVMRQLHRGAVILFHDTMRHTAEALPVVIQRLRAEGYEFVTLP